MPFNIESFKANALVRGGARPSLFEVQVSIPAGIGLSNEAQRRFTFTCEATSVPPMELGEVPVMYFARAVKYHGDRTFPDWQVQVLNDEDFVVRGMFETWNHSMNAMISNYRTPQVTGETAYKSIMTVTQFGKPGNKIRSYEFHGAWPKTVSPMELSWEAANQIQKFGVTFAYDYWIPGINGEAYDVISPINSGDANLF